MEKNMEKKLQKAEQFRKAVQLFIRSLTDEEAMEVATVYPEYEVGKNYKTDDIFSYGKNGVDDPQLYRVEQDHTSQEDWKPDENRALYTPIGLTEEGYAEWAQPSGGHDCYNAGDIVFRNGVLYKSTINGNTYIPEEHPQYWEVYEV